MTLSSSAAAAHGARASRSNQRKRVRIGGILRQGERERSA
jgi:hypothetical protein